MTRWTARREFYSLRFEREAAAIALGLAVALVLMAIVDRIVEWWMHS